MSTADRGGGEAARERLHLAAFERMREVGYAGLRTQEVAARAGVSHGLLFYHFGQRSRLVASTLRWATERFLEEAEREAGVAGASAGPVAERIRTGLKVMVRSGYAGMLLELTAVSHTESLFREAAEEAWEQVVRFFDRLMQEEVPVRAPAAARLQADALPAQVAGAALRMHLQPESPVDPLVFLVPPGGSAGAAAPQGAAVEAAVRRRDWSWKQKNWSPAAAWMEDHA